MASAERTSVLEQRSDVVSAEADAERQSGATSTNDVHRHVIGLFAANVLTILVVGLSFIAYSKLLSPPEFGLYAVALSTATLLALILDGGLKTTIIKLEKDLPREEESSIAVLMILVSLGLILVLVAVAQPFFSLHAEIKRDARFVVLFVGV